MTRHTCSLRRPRVCKAANIRKLKMKQPCLSLECRFRKWLLFQITSQFLDIRNVVVTFISYFTWFGTVDSPESEHELGLYFSSCMKQDRQSTYNITMWHFRVMFIPPRLSNSLISYNSTISLLWRFNVAGNSKTYLRVHVKCPTSTKFGISRRFHKSPQYQCHINLSVGATRIGRRTTDCGYHLDE
jgi:hypothetical protein